MQRQPDIVTLYEVYDKRAIHQGPQGLILLDRDTNQLKAKKSANQWGGCVLKVEAKILRVYPLQREIISWEIFHIHKPRPGRFTKEDRITIRELKGKLRMYDRGLYKKGRL